MDHATRHLSSPSPTSSFLFQHAEKSFKSSASDLLAPLLSSETDNSDVDACFSVAPTLESRADIAFSPNASDDDSRTRCKHSNVPNDREPKLGSADELHHDQTDDGAALILRQFSESEPNPPYQNGEMSSGSGRCPENIGARVRDEDDDDEEEEDDEDMRNVLSGSSRSSATTMPLLTDTHDHHSFSERISLEEYSPLSLVNDCDNALPMSPTSLACGSHHSSFKTSLNNLKIDQLVDGDVGVHVVDDVVGDTRSMSPSLLSNPNPHHSNLWSTSSTAISQNPSLLTGTSTSIILLQHSHHPNQHSHHQLNSFMQQLEPQSLNESHNIISSNLDPDLGGSHSTQTILDRPSSEPPLASGAGALGGLDAKSAFSSGSNPTSIKFTGSSSLCNRSKKSFPSISSNSSSLPSANTNPTSNMQELAASCTTSSRSSSRSRNARQRARANKITQVENNNNNRLSNPQSAADVKPHCSKLHLQLNHHKKLKELQQRLFGNLSPVVDNANGANTETHEKLSGTQQDPSGEHGSREEADSSASNEPTNSSEQSAIKDDAITKSIIENSKGTMTKSSRRASKRKKQDKTQQNTDYSTQSTRSNSDITSQRSSLKCVKTETAEPDTTTKSSDCLKLADLLSSSSGVDILRTNSNFGLVLSSDTLSRLGSSQNNGGEKKIQHIQMSPSLAVVAGTNLNTNDISLVPHTSIQQQLQRGHGILVGNLSTLDQSTRSRQTNSCLASSLKLENGITAGNQIKCNIITSSDANPNEVLKRTTTEDSSWTSNYSIQSNVNISNETISNSNSQAAPNTVSAHQIAIQVICQDGTSLVLPVSSATSINTAVALSTQNQAQLQALLASNNSSVLISNCQQSQRTSAPQLFPVVTMINSQSNLSSPVHVQNLNQTNSSTSGLAASSPTLAALLDAGSNRVQSLNNRVETQHNNQTVISSNLLHKIVANTSVTQNQVEASNDNGSNSTLNVNTDKSTAANELVNNLRAATLTVIEPQGLVVATSNESISRVGDVRKDSNDTVKKSNPTGNNTVTKLLIHDRQSLGNKSTFANNPETTKTNNKNDNGTVYTSNKQITKMTSNTGNRQVDPAQPFRCEHCDSTFTRLGNFTRHKKIHTVPTKDGQRFKCDVCSKSFLQRCDLARHLHIHRGTEPHRCNICGKGYIRHSDLVTHQRFHNKEKPFGCPHCSKGFCQRGDLNRHLRSIHLQMKPILCPCCNRKFAKQETLLRHLNSAHRGSNKPSTTNSGNQITFSDSNPPPTSSKRPESLHNGANNDPPDSEQNDMNPIGSDVKNGEQNLSTGTVNNRTSTSVASLQAIQATLCKVQQNSLDQSKKIKTE